MQPVCQLHHGSVYLFYVPVLRILGRADQNWE